VVGAGSPALDSTLGLGWSAEAVRTDPLLLTGRSTRARCPVVVGRWVGKAQRLASLQLFQRSYGWVAPLDFGVVQRLGVPATWPAAPRPPMPWRPTGPGW